VVIHRIARSLHRADTGGSPYSLHNLDTVTQGWLVVTGGSVARLGLGFIASIIIARSLGL
jgi:hypothetical protein